MTPKESIAGVLDETFRDAFGATGQVQLRTPLTEAELNLLFAITKPRRKGFLNRLFWGW